MSAKALRAAAPVLLAAPMLFCNIGAARVAESLPPCTYPAAYGHARCLTPVDNIADCHFRGGFANRGEAPFTWSGSCRNGLADGEGVLEDREGNRQTGRFLAGLRQGMWRKEWVDGEVHEGPYDGGRVHGFWTLTQADGIRSTGRHERGSAVGEWRIEFPDGRVYRGAYREGRRHGRWIFEHPDGDRMEGRYAHGMEAGRWTYVYSGGRVDEGRKGNGKRVGSWTQVWPDGYSETG
ncbi:MAG: hypothetical protein OXH14_18420, partial [Alphaproteobacteria bacterium]|nr:hypothetical protein [Alphaproteobacteria bacterium]